MTATLAATHAATSLEDLLTRSGPEAVALSGAAQSAWNGQVIEDTGELLGLAHWDGTLYLGDSILDPLRQMYERSGEKQPAADLVRYRESIATILHEQAHFLGPAGATQEAARGAFTRPGGRQLEEGVAEAWAQDHLNDFLSRVGVDKVAPGINDVKNSGYYPAYVPAVRILTAELEKRAGLNRGEVLDALNRQTAEGQLPMVVSLLYNTTRLPELETAAEGAEVRGRLEAVLRDGLPQLDAFEHLPPGFAAARSRSTTGALLDRLNTELKTAESHHTPHPTACALPAPAAGTLPHPTASTLQAPAAGTLPQPTAGASSPPAAEALPQPTPSTLPAPTPSTLPTPTANALPAPTANALPAPTASTHPHPTASTLPAPTANALPAPTAGTLPAPAPGGLPHPAVGALPAPAAGALPSPTAGSPPHPVAGGALPASVVSASTTSTRFIPSAHHVALSGLAPPTHPPGPGVSGGARSADRRAALPRTLAR